MRKILYKQFILPKETDEYRQYLNKGGNPKKFTGKMIEDGTGVAESEFTHEGYFYGWEKDTLHYALIETLDGQVRQVPPSWIKFTDKPLPDGYLEVVCAATTGIVSNVNIMSVINETRRIEPSNVNKLISKMVIELTDEIFNEININK